MLFALGILFTSCEDNYEFQDVNLTIHNNGILPVKVGVGIGDNGTTRNSGYTIHWWNYTIPQKDSIVIKLDLNEHTRVVVNDVKILDKYLSKDEHLDI